MKKLIPILLAVIGIGGGVGAGLMLRPPPAEQDHAEIECIPADEVAKLTKALPPEKGSDEDSTYEYVKLNNQFIVPVIEGQKVDAMVVMSLSVEVPPGQVESVYAREPKLRDAFLQVLFDHANVGGFSGAFTDASTLDVLRRSLLEASHHAVGNLITDVLITEIARQDV